MLPLLKYRCLLLAAIATFYHSARVPSFASAPTVSTFRTPEGGIQPQAVVDQKGGLHLIYFKGDPKRGDLFYTRREGVSTPFTKPLRVNSVAGTAIAAGTIRGGQLAIGRDQNLHVVWNGTDALPQAPYPGVPLYYARLNPAGTTFEAQRDLMGRTGHLDGGATVAADPSGNVYVLWHAKPEGAADGEQQRALFQAKSTDDGATFAKESIVEPVALGACACCGMKAFVNHATGHLFALYRTARTMNNRAEQLLVSVDQGKTFRPLLEHPWMIAACPMSSAAFAAGGRNSYAAWETQGQVHYCRVDADAKQALGPVSAPGSASRKHPTIAVQKDGTVLLAWTEGSGWQKGGALAWQLFDSAGHALPVKGQAEGVPVWGLPAAVAWPANQFTVVF